MRQQSLNYFKQGYSCSEAIIKTAIDKGLVSKELLPVATSFSGGMSSGCLCGAVAASQMVIGSINGKIEEERDGKKARELALKFIQEFKSLHKSTCCKALTAKYDFHSAERREHCAVMVEDCADILNSILELEKEKV